MSDSPDREPGSIRQARFVVPVPAKLTGGASAPASERVRLVDPTGMAVAWLDCGKELVVRAFHLRSGDDPWQEIARDLVVEIPGVVGAGTWWLLERDPTMTRLGWKGDPAVEIRAEMLDCALTIGSGNGVILLVGPDYAIP